MATEKRLIDANAYPCQNCEVSYCYKNCKKFNSWLNDTVDAVEVDAIQAWLYEIAMNNTGNVSRVCEELISRLDGLRVFAKERRAEDG